MERNNQASNQTIDRCWPDLVTAEVPQRVDTDTEYHPRPGKLQVIIRPEDVPRLGLGDATVGVPKTRIKGRVKKYHRGQTNGGSIRLKIYMY